MPFNLLLFPLIAGYVCIHLLYLTRYRAYSLSGYRLLVESVGVGLVLLVPTVLSAAFLHERFPAAYRWWKGLVPADHSGKAALILVWGATTALGLNFLLVLFKKRDDVARLVLRKFGDPLTRLFLSGFERQQPVLVTMRNRKIYVGFVVMSLGLNPKTRHVRLLPIMSGYRDEDTVEAQFTRKYDMIYKEMREEASPLLRRFTASDFQIVLPLERIDSARLFDTKVFAEYFASGART